MKTAEVYKPTDLEKSLAQQGGMRYVMGVAIMHDPLGTESYHHTDVFRAPDMLVDYAQELIIGGLSKVLKLAHSPENRSFAKMESRFDEAYINLVDTQVELYSGERSKIHFPAIAALWPFPVLHEDIYKRFCHGNYPDKLTLKQLMDDVPISEHLRRSSDF